MAFMLTTPTFYIYKGTNSWVKLVDPILPFTFELFCTYLFVLIISFNNVDACMCQLQKVVGKMTHGLDSHPPDKFFIVRYVFKWRHGLLHA